MAKGFFLDPSSRIEALFNRLIRDAFEYPIVSTACGVVVPSLTAGAIGYGAVYQAKRMVEMSEAQRRALATSAGIRAELPVAAALSTYCAVNFLWKAVYDLPQNETRMSSSVVSGAAAGFAVGLCRSGFAMGFLRAPQGALVGAAIALVMDPMATRWQMVPIHLERAVNSATLDESKELLEMVNGAQDRLATAQANKKEALQAARMPSEDDEATAKMKQIISYYDRLTGAGK